jgi:hypothetical protein
MDIPCEGNKAARLYKKAPFRRVLLAAVLLALYAVVIPYCLFTAGEPRKAAVISAQELADKRWAAEAARLAGNLTAAEAALLANSTSSSSTSGDSTTSLLKVGEKAVLVAADEDGEEAGAGAVQPRNETSTSSSSSWLAGWFGPSKEQKRAKKELEKWQKQFNERSEEPLSLPPSFLPSAWACLAFFSVLTIHALFHLLCHWIVSFKALVYFSPAYKVESGYYLFVEPPDNRGKADIVEVKRVGGAGSLLQVEFNLQYVRSMSF